MLRILTLYAVFLLISSNCLSQEFIPFHGKFIWNDRIRIIIDSNQMRNIIRMRDHSQKPALPIKTVAPLKTTATNNTLSPCNNVKAKFSPDQDTIIADNQLIAFTNLSQNASSYDWIIDTYPHSHDVDYYIYPEIGVTSVALVAHNGACTDTAWTYVVHNGTPPADNKHLNIDYGLPRSDETATCMVAAKSNGYLLGGKTLDPFNHVGAYLVRIAEDGCILWTKLLSGDITENVSAIIPTDDFGFLVLIQSSLSQAGAYFIKIDQNGNILWNKGIQSAAAYVAKAAFIETSDNGFLFGAAGADFTGFSLLKMDNLGQALWQKQIVMNTHDFGSFNSLVEKSGFIYASGNYIPANLNYSVSVLAKFDAANGAVQWMKQYASPGKGMYFADLHPYKNGLIVNCLDDTVRNGVHGYSEGLVEFDLDGNALNGKMFLNQIQFANIATNIIVNADNTISLFHSGVIPLDLQPYYADESHLARLDQNKNILWQNMYFTHNADYLAQLAPAPDKGLAFVGSRASNLTEPYSAFSYNFQFAKLDSNGVGPGGYCYMYPYILQNLDIEVNSTDLIADVTTRLDFSSVDQAVPVVATNTEMRYECPDYIPFCSYLKLKGKYQVCNLADTIDFMAHKDPACTGPVTWDYDLTNIKTVYQDGTNARMLFKQPGIYKIKITKPFSCVPVMDSIMITVAPQLTSLSLGNDTSICSGDSLLLTTGSEFSAYQWQDNSQNETFMVHLPGTYSVTVWDSCGNSKIDAVIISLKPQVSIEIGRDTAICLGDSITLHPVGTFNNFSWLTTYRIADVHNINALVFPSIDTVYTFSSNNNIGCKSSGSVRVTVMPRPDVWLGNDTSICKGSSLQLQTNSGFLTYAWNTGDNGPSMVTSQAGKYILRVTDNNHCSKSDTIVVSEFKKPAPDLGQETLVCIGQPRILDAGNGYSRYQWQDGSGTEYFRTSDTGRFWVTVTDLNKCIGSDTIHLLGFAEPPNNFLGLDTVICPYENLKIGPNMDFAYYSWSNGNSDRSVQVKSPGMYWLEVGDQNQCVGRDSVMVTYKECYSKLVFPNAFTPNHDGTNDYFAPKVYRIPERYLLQIYNRYGQMVFQSTDPYKGWDGSFKNLQQSQSAYVWSAVYNFPNETPITEKGTLILLP